MAAKTRGPRQPPRIKGHSRRPTLAHKKRGAKALATNKPLTCKPLTCKSVSRKSRVTGTKGSNATAAAIAAFAHEVRTPLTGILAISDMLATSDLPDRERRWAETIKQGAEHLASLTTLFVDLARGKGRPVLQREQFGLRTLIQTIGDSLTGRATAKGLTANITLAPDIPAVALGDAVRLRAALENLVDNAVKFTDRGSVAMSATAHSSESGQLAVTVAISDSGIGLSLAEIGRLFRPFSQANLGIAARFGGAGLGLASVRKIARAMGGDVTVAARPGGGSVFTMTVILDRAGTPQNVETASRALHILCVEDNPFGRVVFKAVLGELRHNVIFIEQGEKAATSVEHGDFDVVLMDMVLPDITGIAAIRQIRALPPPKGSIPIIGVSGRDKDRAEAISAGANAFAVKPVSPAVLAELLSQTTE